MHATHVQCFRVKISEFRDEQNAQISFTRWKSLKSFALLNTQNSQIAQLRQRRSSIFRIFVKYWNHPWTRKHCSNGQQAEEHTQSRNQEITIGGQSSKLVSDEKIWKSRLRHFGMHGQALNTQTCANLLSAFSLNEFRKIFAKVQSFIETLCTTVPNKYV